MPKWQGLKSYAAAKHHAQKLADPLKIALRTALQQKGGGVTKAQRDEIT